MVQFSSVQISRSVVSNSLRPHELQHARPLCPSPTPRVHPDSHPLSQWCHPAISSLAVPFSRGFSWPRDWTHVSRTVGRFFTIWTTREAYFNHQFSHSVVSVSLQPHESQHTRPPCVSPTPGIHSDSRPSSQWCHPAIRSAHKLDRGLTAGIWLQPGFSCQHVSNSRTIILEDLALFYVESSGLRLAWGLT